MLRFAGRIIRQPRYALHVIGVALGHPGLVLDGLRRGWRPALLRHCSRLCPPLDGAFSTYEAGFFGQVHLFDEYEIGRLSLPVDPVVRGVGANVGFFSWKVHDLRPQARVFACEPQSDNLSRLTRVFAVVGIAGEVCAEALGRQQGEAVLYLHNSVTHSLDPQWHADLGGGRSERVQISTVDALCERHGLQRIDVLKIDTEGAEVDVLAGSTAMLTRTRFVVLEYHSRERGAQCLALLKNAGFRCRRKSFWGLQPGSEEEGLLLCAR